MATLPPDLLEFAAQVADSADTFAARYDRLLDFAFRAHGQTLNASVLRQLAGGGSQTTAQDAINRYRTKLSSALAQRVSFGTEIPPALAETLNGVATELWDLAVSKAAAEFDGQRSQLAAERDTALRNAQAATDTMDAQRERLASQAENISRLEAEAAEQAASWTKYKAAADAATQDLQDRLRDALALADRSRQEAGRLQTQVSEVRAELASAAEAARAERDDMRKAHMVDMDRVRTEGRAAAAALAKEVGELRGQLDSTSTRLAAEQANMATTTAQLAAQTQVSADLRLQLQAAAEQFAGAQRQLAELQTLAVANARLQEALAEQTAAAAGAHAATELLRAELAAAARADAKADASASPASPKAKTKK